MTDLLETAVSQAAALPRVVVGLLVSVLAVGCSAQADPAAHDKASGTPAAQVPSTSLAALHGPRLRPDVLVTGALSARQVRAVASLAPSATAFSLGTVRIGTATVRVASVDPATFRRFSPAGTAESTALWQAVAGGQVIASHETAKRLRLALGTPLALRGARTVTVRLGGLATTGIPGTDLVVGTPLGIELGVTKASAILLTAGKADPTALAAKARKAAGSSGDVDLLTPPAVNPMAFLTGSRAARAFGAFSYRYFPDGTIVPDARWVRQSIVTQRVPIFGAITCHRLMFPQLRGALEDVVQAGLASTLRTYNGCYVPRFIERDPSHAVSLHTWGIAIDFDSVSNGRGSRGTMDPRVVTIFKRWGFRWGGDWDYTDPMHFELGALLTSR